MFRSNTSTKLPSSKKCSWIHMPMTGLAYLILINCPPLPIDINQLTIFFCSSKNSSGTTSENISFYDITVDGDALCHELYIISRLLSSSRIPQRVRHKFDDIIN